MALGWPGLEANGTRWPASVGEERPGRRQPGAAQTPAAAFGQAILPAQFAVPRRGAQQSLRRLMLAILDDAIRTYQKFVFVKTRAGRALFHEAETWLMGDDDGAGVRFGDVCDFLDLDPDWVRRALRAWRARVTPPARDA